MHGLGLPELRAVKATMGHSPGFLLSSLPCGPRSWRRWRSGRAEPLRHLANAVWRVGVGSCFPEIAAQIESSVAFFRPDRAGATSCGRRASRRADQREDAPTWCGRSGGRLEAAASTGSSAIGQARAWMGRPALEEGIASRPRVGRPARRRRRGLRREVIRLTSSGGV